MVHGWMDVSASFQFVVDAFAEDRHIVAPDWRGYGLTDWPRTDGYWFADYLADLDAVIDHIAPDQPVDLLGHSMGGNVAMMYSGRAARSACASSSTSKASALPATRPGAGPGPLGTLDGRTQSPAPRRAPCCAPTPAPTAWPAG